MPSIDTHTAITGAASDLGSILIMCKTLVDSAPEPTFLDEKNLANAIVIVANDRKNRLSVSFEKYIELITGPFASSNQTQINEMWIFINASMDNYKTEILPKYCNLTENILNKEKALQEIATSKRNLGINRQTNSEIASSISEARTVVTNIRNNNIAQQKFSGLDSFEKKAKEYVQALSKAISIAISIFSMSPSSSMDTGHARNNVIRASEAQEYKVIDKIVSEAYRATTSMQLFRSATIVTERLLDPLAKLKDLGVDEQKVDNIRYIPLGTAMNYYYRFKQEYRQLEAEISRQQFTQNSKVNGLTQTLSQKVGRLKFDGENLKLLDDDIQTMDKHFQDLWGSLITCIPYERW